MENNIDSVLDSIKKLLGIPKEYDAFDTDLIIHINSVFAILTQIGVGSPKGFSIKGSSDKWIDFIPEDNHLFESVRTYVYLKVKLLFDPASLSSAAIASTERLISELECRLNVSAESTIPN